MSSDYEKADDDLSGLEPVLKAFTQIRQDNADLILLLQAQRERRQKRRLTSATSIKSKVGTEATDPSAPRIGDAKASASSTIRCTIGPAPSPRAAGSASGPER